MYLLASAIANIKSACLNRLFAVKVRNNVQILELCRALEELGFIAGYTILNNFNIKIFLKYNRNRSIIRGLNLFSKPSSRVYLKKKNVKGVGVLSYIKKHSFILFNNSKTTWLLTDVELLMLGIGGEPIFVVS